MAFSNYTAPSEVARAYQINIGVESFVKPLAYQVPDRLRTDLAFTFAHIPLRRSEFAVCESLIYPILKEVWIPYAEDLQLWCHTPLTFDKDLTGTPDYFLARRSSLGMEVMEEPYLMVMEAKRDDFDWGWGQCLAGMVAAQKLNGSPSVMIHGVVTNGRAWEFGKLVENHFLRDPGAIGLANLEDVCGAIAFVFDQCRHQLATYAGAA